jgi:hypothetical protein
MKIVIKNKAIKTNNFINYLVENHSEKNKTHKFQIIAEDKYDRRFIIEKEHDFKGKVLVMHNDGFDVVGNNILEDYEEFKQEINNLIDSKEFTDLYAPDNFKKQFVHYQLKMKDGEEEWDFLFHFLDISKSVSI